ncbi:MAG: flavodoxin FldA, partial [Desertifilum sp. SIO1I2]|nr:flavodoxin FldA [Desertifilum sp. SIO1I2]
DFTESKAIKNGKFVGLAIDEDNQPELTEERVKAWVAQLKREFSL